MAPNQYRPWSIRGFSFNKPPFSKPAVFLAILTQTSFMPSRLPRGTVRQLRIETNLRVIFEAVYHFSRFLGAVNFWARIRDVLGFDVKTKDYHLEDIVNAYCAGRIDYVFQEDPPGSVTRMEALADEINEVRREARDSPWAGYSVSHLDWQKFYPAWLDKLYQVKRDLGVTDEQMENGTCDPQLRMYCSLAARTTPMSPRMRKQDEALAKQTAGYSSKHDEHSTRLDLQPKRETSNDERRKMSNQVRSPRQVFQSHVATNSSEVRDACVEQRPRKRRHSECSQQTSPEPKRTAIGSLIVEPQVSDDNIVAALSAINKTKPQQDQSTDLAANADDQPSLLSTTAEHAKEKEEVAMELDSPEVPTQPDCSLPPRSPVQPTASVSGPRKSPSLTSGTEPGMRVGLDFPRDTDKMSNQSHNIVELVNIESRSPNPTQDAMPLPMKVPGPEPEPSDAVHELLMSLELRQKRLEDMEASMRVWQEQFAKQPSMQSQERIEKLEAQVQHLSAQLNQSEQKRVSSMELLGKTLENEQKQRSINRQRVDKLENTIKTVGQPKDQTSQDVKIEALRALVVELQEDRGLYKERIERLESSTQTTQGTQTQATVARVHALETRFEELKKSQVSGQDQMTDMTAEILNLTNLIDARPEKKHLTKLAACVKGVESRLKELDRRGDQQQSSTNDLVGDFEKHLTELREEVTQQTFGLEGQLKRIESRVNQVDGQQSVFNNLAHELEKRHTELRDKVAQRISGSSGHAKDSDKHQHVLGDEMTQWTSGSHDLIEDLKKRHSDLKDDVAQRTSEFETAVNELQTHVASLAPRKGLLRKFHEELEDLRAQHAQHSQSLKELTSSNDSIKKQVERIPQLEEDVKTFKKQRNLKTPGKRIESLEQTTTKLWDLLHQNSLTIEVKSLATAIGALETRLLGRASEERVTELATVVQDVKAQMLQGSNAVLDKVATDLCDVREYMDHSLEMTKFITQKNVQRLKEQVEEIQKGLRHTQLVEQPLNPVTSIDTALNLRNDDRFADLQRQFNEVREQLRLVNGLQIPVRLLSPSISDLESLAGQPGQPAEVKDFMANVMTQIKGLKGLMRNKLLELDNVEEADEDKKGAIAEVAFELDSVLRFTRDKILKLS
ncbi:hypothetical protein BKA67DRAFT_577345 [Truncatella angustata]|uniref:Uncharacterized protein n=1 Tax=Truncatella angustata TaxID=152316 RepID=A0A9P8RPP3_9PEZI|nr:uncharacterized protein BKA67DRAFT_577345 [Truncatella angustata]KAH6647402.1 hypothetical protein BKA67DRAFT_577345 [Truncatella angustata]